MNDSAKIRAIIYDKGDGVAAASHALAAHWARKNLAVCGLIEEKIERAGRKRCDMVLTEIGGGVRIPISEDRGPQARGCHLDVDAFAYAASLVRAALLAGAERVVFNKFGKVECEGGGLRAVIALALEQGTPMVVFVPRRNLGPWREFVGQLATEMEITDFAAALAPAQAASS